MFGRSNYTKLHIWSFGFALGALWSLTVLVTGLLAAMTGFGMVFVDMIRNIYLGYSATFFGSIIGGVWAFVDMFIGGVIIAAFYNFSLRFCQKHHIDAK